MTFRCRKRLSFPSGNAGNKRVFLLGLRCPSWEDAQGGDSYSLLQTRVSGSQAASRGPAPRTPAPLCLSFVLFLP